MTDDKDKIDHAMKEVEREVPGKAKRFIAWARSDRARKVRVPLAMSLIGVGIFFPYMPVVGIEDVPIGLLLLSYDLPFLRAPMAALVLKLVKFWRRLKVWWKT
ncbi:hypothetical protein E4L96_09855 [Massilia arenosa]|uniref:Uncharacterized protein n=1 Tax=Zemynaea arenosa TaxID=2561931 RepID=A0A4Y9SDM7_9BURK|nr:hypothetical protein [Massilia arenosa]TFW20797.1 hypothetical protein E4L96_09855 [Massilia arenosa]